MLRKGLLILLAIAWAHAQNIEGENWQSRRTFPRFGSRVIPRPVFPSRPVPTTSHRPETTTEEKRRETFPSTHRPFFSSTYNPPRRPIFVRPRPVWSRPFYTTTTAKPVVTVVVLPGDHSYKPSTPKPHVTYVYPENYKPSTSPKPADVPIAHESEPIYSEPMPTVEQQPEVSDRPQFVPPSKQPESTQSPSEFSPQVTHADEEQKSPSTSAAPTASEPTTEQERPTEAQEIPQPEPEVQQEPEIQQEPENKALDDEQPESQSKPESQPQSVELQPESKPESKPNAAPTSAEQESEAQPKPKPQPNPQSSPAPQPEVQQPESQPEVQQPESQPEVQQPESQPEVQQPESQPEVQQPESQPEVQQPESQPEVQQAESQPEEEPPQEPQSIVEPQPEIPSPEEKKPEETKEQPSQEQQPSLDQQPESEPSVTEKPQPTSETSEPEALKKSEEDVQQSSPPESQFSSESTQQPDKQSPESEQGSPVKMRYIPGIGSSRNPISSKWPKPNWPQFSKPSTIPDHPYPWKPTTAKPIALPSRPRPSTIFKPKPFKHQTTRKPDYEATPRKKSPVESAKITGLKDYQCQEPNGYYAVPNQCDAFLECEANRAKQVSCPDGLHFNPRAVWPEYPCAYPSQVRCAAHYAKQAPKPSAACPRQYGYFPSPSNDCGEYIMCQEGQATKMSCPPGLGFNFETSSCDWPANVPSCSPDVFKGFTCPAPDPEEDEDKIYTYRYEKSCKKYIACQRRSPRLLSCDEGLSYDDVTQNCVDEELVTDCS